jgi:hypothetical protein
MATERYHLGDQPHGQGLVGADDPAAQDQV